MSGLLSKLKGRLLLYGLGRIEGVAAPAPSSARSLTLPVTLNLRIVATVIPASALLAVLALGLGIWLRMEPLAFQGGDGKAFQTFILNYLRYGGPFQVNILNPLQGAFAAQLPLNTWLNPGYVVFRLLELEHARIASLAVAFLALAIPTYLLGRASGLGPAAAAVAGQATIATLPPFIFLFGFNTQYMLVPPSTATVGLQTLALVALLRLSSLRPRPVLICSLAVFAIFYAALVVDPFWSVAVFLTLALFLVVIAVGAARPGLMVARASAVVLALAGLYLIGAIGFQVIMVKFTARDFFRQELGHQQMLSEVSMLFAHPLVFGRTLLFLASGWVLGVLLTRGARRILAVSCLLHWLFVLGQGAIWLFAGIDWPGVAPFYLEQVAYHLYILGAVSGWAGLMERVVPDRARARAWGAFVSISFIPLLLAWYFSEAVPVYRAVFSEPPPQYGRLTRTLRASIGQDGDGRRPFQGSVVLMEIPDGHTRIQTTIALWREAIPTLNEYSQLLTPASYYLGSRFLSPDLPKDLMLGRPVNMVPFARPAWPIFGLMGVRFILTHEVRTIPNSVSHGPFDGLDVNGRPVRWYLYEIAEPNLGQYSPTEQRRAGTAAAMLAALASPGIDFRQTVVLEPGEELPSLRPARRMSIFVERGRIRISGESDGNSLDVLPIQYSRCLRLVGAGSARLVRADLMLTGLFFTGRIEADIAYDFGFTDSSCLRTDYADLHRLAFASDPAYYSANGYRHPLAIERLGQVPERLRKIAGQVRQAVEADRWSRFQFGGPITRAMGRMWRWLTRGR